jgi:hypothetical protein
VRYFVCELKGLVGVSVIVRNTSHFVLVELGVLATACATTIWLGA